MLGRASSNVLIAASPLLTSTISKLPSAKVCVTSRRIVGLSSAIRIIGFIPLEFLQRPRYQKRADWVRPFSWSPIPLLARRGTPQRSFFAGGLPGCTTLESILKSPVVSPLPDVPPLTLVGAVFSSASAAEEAAP